MDSKKVAHALFSATVFLGSLYALLTLQIYRTESAEAYVSRIVIQYVFAAIILSLLTVFTAVYSEISARKGLWIVVGLHAVSAIVVFTAGGAAVAPGLQHMKQVVLPWSEVIYIPAESINRWLPLLELPTYGTLGYMLYAFWNLRQRGQSAMARTFLIAVLVIVGTIALADLNTYLDFTPIVLPELGFFAMMLVVSLNLSANLAEGHYRAFIADSTAICRIEFHAPVPLDLPEEEQMVSALASGYVAECNERFAQIRGGRARDFAGMPVRSLTVTSDHENLENIRQLVRAKYNIRNLETHGRDLSGRDIYLVSDYRGEIENGCLVRLWLSQQDITDKRLAEASARLSEERLEVALEAANVGVWRWDVATNRVEWSDSVAPIFGLAKGEFGGTFEAVEALVHPRDRRRLMAVIQQCMFGKRVEFVVEHRAIWKDGSIRWIEARGRSRTNASGAVVELRGSVMDITERKQAEGAIRESRERFSRLCEATFEGIAISLEGRIIDANEQLARMLGYEVSELIGRSPMELASQDFTIQVQHNVLSGHEGAYEHAARRRDGSIFPVEVRARMLRVGDQVWRVSAIRDISDRIAAQKALRESAERFRLVAEQTGQLIYDYDLTTGRIVQWAGGIEAVTGYTPEEFTSFTMEEFIGQVHPEDKVDVVRHVQRSLTMRRPFQIEYRFRTKSGDYAVLEDRGVFLKDDAGDFARMLGSISDITSRRRAEEAVKTIAKGVSSTTGDAFFRTLVENLGVALRADCVLIGEVPPDLSRAESIATWTKEGVGENFTYLLKGTPCEEVASGRSCTIPAGIATQFPADTMLVDMNAEGYSGVPLMNTEGKVIGLMVVLFVTPIQNPGLAESTLQIFASRAAGEIERRRSEAKVLQMNVELENRVEQRTQELSAVNRELESFSYSVSHDLRAPLRNISGFVELLSMGSATQDGENRRYFETISKEVRRMGILIDDLLELSRVSRTEMLLVTVDPAAIVAEVRETLAMEMRGRSIEWRIGELPKVKGDRLLLQQVFANLISNAVKYTKYREQAIIEVGWAREKGIDEETVFYVRDNGVGFDMKYVGKLFGVFQRLHSVKQFEGTGIGLANVQRIVHRHGGRVWAEAALNQGATFFVSLPS